MADDMASVGLFRALVDCSCMIILIPVFLIIGFLRCLWELVWFLLQPVLFLLVSVVLLLLSVPYGMAVCFCNMFNCCARAQTDDIESGRTTFTQPAAPPPVVQMVGTITSVQPTAVLPNQPEGTRYQIFRYTTDAKSKYFASDGDEGDAADCPICLRTFEEEEECVVLTCQHVYHRECIDKWLPEKRSCPVCRQQA